MHVLRDDKSDKKADGVRFTSPTPTPANLYVNREARTAALKYFQKSSTSVLRPFDQPGSIIYVNLANETIFLTCETQEDLIYGLVKMDIAERHMVMNVAVEQKLTHFKSLMTAYALAIFPALKRGIMAMQDDRDDTREAGPKSKKDYSHGIVLRDLFGPDKMHPYFLEYEFHRILCTHVDGHPDLALYELKPKFFKRKLMLESLKNI